LLDASAPSGTAAGNGSPSAIATLLAASLKRELHLGMRIDHPGDILHFRLRSGDETMSWSFRVPAGQDLAVTIEQAGEAAITSYLEAR
jgi:hypothetical protein